MLLEHLVVGQEKVFFSYRARFGILGGSISINHRATRLKDVVKILRKWFTNHLSDRFNLKAVGGVLSNSSVPEGCFVCLHSLQYTLMIPKKL